MKMQQKSPKSCRFQAKWSGGNGYLVMCARESRVNAEDQYEIGDHGEYYYKDNGDELDLRKAMDVSFTVKSIAKK